MKQYSAGIEVRVPGVKMICESRKKGSVMVTKLHCALRDIKTFAEIENIVNSESKYIPMDARTTDNINEQILVDMKTSGGIFKDMTIHDFDTARHILGEEPVEIFATASRLVDEELETINDYDTCSITLKT